MIIYKFKNLEGVMNCGRKIINLEKRADYECPHVIFQKNTYILKNGGWVYILEDFASSRFAVFCEKCLKKVRIIEID